MKNMLFVFNPNSGKAQLKNSLMKIIQIFSNADYEVTVYPTKAALDGYEKIKASKGLYDIIVCSGGDGTLNEVVSAVITYGDEKVPIGYIPSGSTNDFAKSLGIPSDKIRAAYNVVSGESFSCDIGIINDRRYFNYVAAFGAFTEVSWNTPQKTKNALGHNAYILEGIRQVGNLKPYQVRFSFDDEEIAGECIYAMVYNSFSVGGMKNISGQNVELDDGKLNLMIVYRPDNAVDFSVMLADLVTKNPNSKFIANYEISDLIVESDSDIDWVLDGEYGGSHKKVHIQAMPQAMKIAVPAETIPQEK